MTYLEEFSMTNKVMFRPVPYVASQPSRITLPQLDYDAALTLASTINRSAVDAAVLGLLETAIEKLRDSKKETQGVFQNPSAPIVVIDGHWCPLSLDEKAQRGNGRYTLRIPYAGASNSGVDVYLLPQWLSDVVGGGPVSRTNYDNRDAIRPHVDPRDPAQPVLYAHYKEVWKSICSIF